MAVAVTAAGSVLVWSGRPLVFMPGRGELSLIGIHFWIGGLAGVGWLLAFVAALDALFRRSLMALFVLWTGWAMACVGLVTGFWFVARELVMLREAVTAPGSGVSETAAAEVLGSLALLPAASTLVALLAVVPPAVWIAGWRRTGENR